MAIADQGRAAASENTLTSAAAAVYSLPSSDFHDITSGSNGQYSATKGYDEVTGLGSPLANQVIQGLVGTTTAQQTFTTATLTTTTHRGFSLGGGGQRRFDDVGGDDSTSLLMTGVTFNTAAGSSFGTNPVVNVGSQFTAGPITAASELTTSLLASGTVQQTPGGPANSMLSTTDLDATSADAPATGVSTAGLAFAGQSETVDHSAQDLARQQIARDPLASTPTANATALSLVDSLDALFGGGADWADRHAGIDAGDLGCRIGRGAGQCRSGRGRACCL